MQEEVNEKTISLCIKGGKITAQILKAALIKLLTEMDKKKQRGKGEKSHRAMYQRRKNHRADFESSPVKAALKDGEEETAGERRKKPM